MRSFIVLSLVALVAPGHAKQHSALPARLLSVSRLRLRRHEIAAAHIGRLLPSTRDRTLTTARVVDLLKGDLNTQLMAEVDLTAYLDSRLEKLKKWAQNIRQMQLSSIFLVAALVGCWLCSSVLPQAFTGEGLSAGACAGAIGAGAASFYISMLNAHPLPTKVATAAVLASMGDALAQFKKQQVQREQAIVATIVAREAAGAARATKSEMLRIRQAIKFDKRRNLGFALFGAIYTGAFQHNLFPWLMEHFKGTFLADLFSGMGLQVDQHLFAAVERTCVNQLACIPLLYYPTYFAVTGAISRLNVTAIVQRAQALYLPLLRRNLAFWIPIQLLQFATVPMELQVPYVCVAGLVWNTIMSTMASRPATPRPAPVAAKALARSEEEEE